MDSASESVPDDVLDDMAFLARADNRIRILGLLSRGAHPPREVADQTATSRSTLRRIPSELEDRGWAVRRSDGAYSATPTGQLVVGRLYPFITSLETIRHLGETVAGLPIAELSLDAFSDAIVIGQAPNDPLAPASFIT